MGGKFIIVIMVKGGELVALQDDQDADTLAVFPTSEDAQKEADEHILCRAYPYQIIEVDL